MFVSNTAATAPSVKVQACKSESSVGNYELPRRASSSYAMMYYDLRWCAALCCAVPCCAVLRRAALRCAELRCAVLCYDVILMIRHDML